MDLTLLLIRTADDPRAQIEASVGETEVMAHIDLAGGRTRIGWGPVYAEDLPVRDVEDRTGPWRKVVIPELKLSDDVVLKRVVAEVGGEEDLVIGFSAIEGVEAAVLPSEGVVRIASDGLVNDPSGRRTQPRGPYYELGRKRWGDGLTARLQAQMDERVGLVHLRTDLRQSTRRDGPGAVEVEVAGLPLPVVHATRDDRVRDPAADWLGALGADALYATDIAASPEGVTLAPAETVSWTDGSDRVVELAGLDDERATALWRRGDVAASLEASERALRSDDCLGWLVLGMRRLRAAEPEVLRALDEGMTLYGAWASLDPRARQRVREGRSVPDGSGPQQDDSCSAGTGRWLLARLALGAEPQGIVDDARGLDDGDDWTALAGGIAALRAGDLEVAHHFLQASWQRGGGSQTWLALAVVHARAGRKDAARASYERLVAADPHPLLTAWVGYQLDLLPLRDGPQLEGWLARQAVRASVGGEDAIDPEAVRHARWRTADAPWALAVAHLAEPGASGQELAVERYEARSPDVWVARILAGQGGVEELLRRFPELALP